MGITKIKTIEKQDSTWKGQSGIMYDYYITLEDGEEGTASSTSAEAPPYSEGDEVEYTKRTNNWGTKLSIKKAGGNFSGGGGFKKDPETIKRIENSWAINTAVLMIGAQKMPLEDYLQQMRDTARILLTERDDLS